MKLTCKHCGEELSITNLASSDWKYTNIDGSRLKSCCKNCAKQIVSKLKKQYCVEVYKNCNIYCKDGKYLPYWGCQYYFKSLDDCKKRIDNATCVMISRDDLCTLNSLLNDD